MAANKKKAASTTSKKVAPAKGAQAAKGVTKKTATATASTSKKKKTTKTYYPPKTFDDDLVGLVDLYTTEKWSFSGVDFDQLTKDTTDQRSERLAHDSLEAQFDKIHQSFGEAQEARHQRFSAALNAARGAFRNDKAVMAQLDQFKRSVTRKAKPKGSDED